MPNTLILTSPAFAEGEWIPMENSGYGADISPALHLEGLDSRAVSLVVTLDDLSHPLFPDFNHWVAWNLPPVSDIPSALPKGAVVDKPLKLCQGMAYGKHGYRGPKPPFNWDHQYRFTVYTLDSLLGVDSNADKAAVLQAAARHILQTGQLTGHFQRRHG